VAEWLKGCLSESEFGRAANQADADQSDAVTPPST
jgi:hypothetical protein